MKGFIPLVSLASLKKIHSEGDCLRSNCGVMASRASTILQLADDKLKLARAIAPILAAYGCVGEGPGGGLDCGICVTCRAAQALDEVAQ